jgi:tetratricopeptide (TPR) repeat protein
LQNAIDADPTYALAYSGLADAYYDASNMLLPPADAMPKAKAAAQRAVSLDPRLAEAHVSLGLIASKYDWNWAEAENQFQTALRLDANSALAHQWYGLYRAQLGDTNRAVTELRRAQELDPLSNDANGYLATTLYWARRYDEALQQARKVIEFDPTFTPGQVGMCWILTAQRRLPEVRAACEKGFAQDPSPWTTLALARVNALAGNRTAAEQAIRGLQDRPEQFVSGYDLAVVYAALDKDKKEEAFAALEDAYRRHAEWFGYLKIDPQVDALRSDPRFAGLLIKLGT